MFLLGFLSHISFLIIQKQKDSFFVMGVLSILTLLISFILLNKKTDLNSERFGIIYPQEINVKTEPNLRSENAFVLHEGTKVQIIESYKSNWLKIKLIDGNIDGFQIMPFKNSNLIYLWYNTIHFIYTHFLNISK